VTIEHEAGSGASGWGKAVDPYKNGRTEWCAREFGKAVESASELVEQTWEVEFLFLILDEDGRLEEDEQRLL